MHCPGLSGMNRLRVVLGCCLMMLSGLAAADAAQASKLPWVAGQNDVSDLPLVEMRVASANDTLVILMTGDGGWAPIDKALTQYFNAAGLSVLGWDMLHYFWTARTPDSAGHDLARLIAHYLPAWNKRRIVIVGYSLGADTAPFLLRRLPEELLARVSGVALLAASKTTYFEFHVTNWLNMSSSATSYPVLPEAAALAVPDILCVGVADEADTLCPSLDRKRVHIEMLHGGHHFGEDYLRLANLIMSILHLK
jgi:type IV secretory pathway VirJ component